MIAISGSVTGFVMSTVCVAARGSGRGWSSRPRIACLAARAAAILQAGQRISRQLRVVSDKVAVFRPGVSACKEDQVSRVGTAQT